MKAISPVIATVIIVAVAIVIAVAVAFWMTGITGIFTRYEKLEITYAYATKEDNHWKVTLRIRNTGPSDATIDEIFINGRPLSAVSGVSSYAYAVGTATLESYTYTEPISITVKSGEEVTIVLDFSEGFKAGQTVEIKIHTAAGNEYPKQVTLP